MCEKGQRLRVLVNERLTAAAQEIFALFERTIAEYEEELCRSKEENKRKQQLLDSVLSPRVLLHRTDVQTRRVVSAGPSPQQITETAQINKETKKLSIKQEEEQFKQEIIVSVKNEDQSTLLQQRQTEENREKTEDFSLDPHLLSQEQTGSSRTDNDEDWKPTAQQKQTEADRVHKNHCTAAQNSSETKQCLLCGETDLKIHMDVHRQEEPYSCSDYKFNEKHQGQSHKTIKCSVCKKCFTTVGALRNHMPLHTGERPYSCPVCNRGFIQKVHLRSHLAVHTGVRPFSCSECHSRFAVKQSLIRHMKVHSGEKPYSCSICNKSFTYKASLTTHMKSHLANKPFRCSVCSRGFNQKALLTRHMSTHTGVKPFRCSVCPKGFVFQCDLQKHMKSHKTRFQTQSNPGLGVRIIN